MLLRIDQSKPNQAMIKIAASMASIGQLVAFPTDTIYGIGTSSYSISGVIRLFSCKKRAVNKPLGVFMSDFNQLHLNCRLTKAQESFLKTIWPGPITCILSRSDNCQIFTVPQKNQPTTVAVRIPESSIACELVKQLGHPLLQTSINISGTPHCSYEELLINYGQFADVMIDGGAEVSDAPSTIINLTGKKAKLVRTGSTAWCQIANALETAGIEVENQETAR